MISHGQNAATALLRADMVAPHSPIIAIHAGKAGIFMWRAKLTLARMGNLGIELVGM